MVGYLTCFFLVCLVVWWVCRVGLLLVPDLVRCCVCGLLCYSFVVCVFSVAVWLCFMGSG